jgi:large subunit ribosomal protein L34e
MAQRVTYRRRVGYATKSNIIKCVKTPGGKLSVQYPKKNGKHVYCGEPGCDKKLTGIKKIRPFDLKSMKKRERTVSRAYGGNLCGDCVKSRIIRAFLIEEVKIVKRVMSQKKKE